MIKSAVLKTLTFKLHIIFILLFFCSPAMAVVKCEFHLVPEIEFIDDSLRIFHEQEKVSILKTLQDASLAFRPLKIPPRLKIHYGNRFGYRNGIIYIATFERMNDAALLHEFGHAILDYNLMLRLGERFGSASLDLLKKRPDLLERVNEAYHRDYYPKVNWLPVLACQGGSPQVDPRSRTPESDEAYQRYRLAFAEYEANERKLRELSHTFGIDHEFFLGGGVPETENEMLLPKLPEYDELFADLVAVLQLKDPEAVSKSILFNMPAAERSNFEAQRSLHWRSFSSRIPVRGWKYDHPKPHGAMAPSRSFIGEFLLGGALRNVGPFLNSVIEVVWQLGLIRSQNGINLDPEALNAQFINAIVDELYGQRQVSRIVYLYLSVITRVRHP